MKEIEIKLRYNAGEQSKIVAYCVGKGYADLGEVEQRDLYLTPCHKNLFAQDEALRIRMDRSSEKCEWFLTYKGANADQRLHSRQELETSVEDGDVLLSVLERLDFRTILEVRKQRRSYKKESVTICLDQVDGLGSFLEVEELCDDAESDAVKARIEGIVTEIGLSIACVETKNYLQLLAERKLSGADS